MDMTNVDSVATMQLTNDAQELLTMVGKQDAIWLVIHLILVALCVLFAFYTARKCPTEHELGAFIGAVLILLVLSTFGCAYDLIQVLVAPKIWLLAHARDLLK